MLTDITARLAEAIARDRELKKLESRLEHAREGLDELLREQGELEAEVAKERRDVESLEGLGLSALYHRVVGSHDSELRRERSEYAAAKLKLEEHAALAEEARAEVERLSAEAAALADAPEVRRRLVDEKAALLVTTGDERAGELLSISEQLAGLDADERELAEAIEAGRRANRRLREVAAFLEKARGWGTWDLLGGGMLSTYQKHSYLDAANESSRLAQRALGRFRAELADAGENLNTSLQLSAGTRFMDMWFDNFFTDMSVQGQIKQAQDSCARISAEVVGAVRRCDARLQEAREGRLSLEARRRELVETSS